MHDILLGISKELNCTATLAKLLASKSQYDLAERESILFVILQKKK